MKNSTARGRAHRRRFFGRIVLAWSLVALLFGCRNPINDAFDEQTSFYLSPDVISLNFWAEGGITVIYPLGGLDRITLNPEFSPATTSYVSVPINVLNMDNSNYVPTAVNIHGGVVVWFEISAMATSEYSINGGPWQPIEFSPGGNNLRMANRGSVVLDLGPGAASRLEIRVRAYQGEQKTYCIDLIKAN